MPRWLKWGLGLVALYMLLTAGPAFWHGVGHGAHHGFSNLTTLVRSVTGG